MCSRSREDAFVNCETTRQKLPRMDPTLAPTHPDYGREFPMPQGIPYSPTSPVYY